MVKGSQMGLGRGLLAVMGVALLGIAVLGDDEQVKAAGDGLKPPQPPDPLGHDPTRPPSRLEWPEGWERFKGTATPTMIEKANAAIKEGVPLGYLVPGGTLAEGQKWAVFLEWHYHPPGQGFAAEGWHRGATLVWRQFG